MWQLAPVSFLGCADRNVIYQTGDKRTACDFSSFMFHGARFDIKSVQCIAVRGKSVLVFWSP